MSKVSINVDAGLKKRLANLAGQMGQNVDEFAETLLSRIVSADVRFERGVPVLPPRPGAPVLTDEEVERLGQDSGE